MFDLYMLATHANLFQGNVALKITVHTCALREGACV